MSVRGDQCSDSLEDGDPVFFLHHDGAVVAELYDPQYVDMFWCGYRVKPTSAFADAVIHNETIWQKVDFAVKSADGTVPNQHTFTGGFRTFCERKTDRLTFRSLWPPTPHVRPTSAFQRILLTLRRWILGQI
jgi:hypothetical protein